MSLHCLQDKPTLTWIEIHSTFIPLTSSTSFSAIPHLMSPSRLSCLASTHLLSPRFESSSLSPISSHCQLVNNSFFTTQLQCHPIEVYIQSLQPWPDIPKQYSHGRKRAKTVQCLQVDTYHTMGTVWAIPQ